MLAAAGTSAARPNWIRWSGLGCAGLVDPGRADALHGNEVQVLVMSDTSHVRQQELESYQCKQGNFMCMDVGYIGANHIFGK